MGVFVLLQNYDLWGIVVVERWRNGSWQGEMARNKRGGLFFIQLQRVHQRKSACSHALGKTVNIFKTPVFLTKLALHLTVNLDGVGHEDHVELDFKQWGLNKLNFFIGGPKCHFANTLGKDGSIKP